MNDIQVSINAESKKIPENLNIPQLLNFLELKDGLLVVELNEEVVMRADWETTTVGEGDKLEIVKAIGGGYCPIHSELEFVNFSLASWWAQENTPTTN